MRVLNGVSGEENARFAIGNIGTDVLQRHDIARLEELLDTHVRTNTGYSLQKLHWIRQMPDGSIERRQTDARMLQEVMANLSNSAVVKKDLLLCTIPMPPA